jgi:hypothetical protein
MADALSLVTAEHAEQIAERAAELAVRRVLAERQTPDELLTLRQAAERLGVSLRAVRAYVAAGELPCVRLPSTAPAPRKRGPARVRASAVADLIARCERRDDADSVIDLAVERAYRKAGT